MTYPTLGYTVTSAAASPGDKPRALFRFDCTKCDATLLITPGRLTGEGVALKARRAGWAAHHLRASEALCPACLHPKPTNGGTMEPKKMLTGTLKLPPPVPVDDPLPLGLKHLTAEQRMMARGLLDQHFDDKAGYYLEGYSDERVAAEVGVALALVRTMREAAYGPIRVSAPVLALRTDLGLLKAAVADQLKVLDGLGEQARALQARLDKLGSAG